MIRVLVADAQRLLAESIRAALALQPEIEVAADAPQSGLEAVEVVVRSAPDVALIDYWMQGMEGPAATRLILKRAPNRKIILLGWFHGPAEVEAAGASGALALLSKEIDVEELAEAIRRAHAGENLAEFGHSGGTPPENPSEEAVWQRLVTLTPREIEILSALSATGRPDEVAKKLSLTTGTVRLHIQHILAKTGARSHVEAVVMAREHGLI